MNGLSAILFAFATRATVGVGETVPTLDVGRYTNLTESWGGVNATNSSVPNFGLAVWNIVNVYPDAVGQLAWVLLFSLPFIAMWITNADMVPAAILGIFLGVYIFAFIGSQYGFVAVAFIIISMTSIVWSMWQKRG